MTLRFESLTTGLDYRTTRKRLYSGKVSGGWGVLEQGLVYLVQTLVAQYGGDIWVEDDEPTGTAIVVELPRAD
ncbi:hypothetical protein LPA46_18225 [Halobacterium sp. KA-6]|nr:hypothetical protein [Halobacterium sp. KA-6]